MLIAAPPVAHIPQAALADVSLATAVRMVEFSPLAALGRASRSEALVMAHRRSDPGPSPAADSSAEESPAPPRHGLG